MNKQQYTTKLPDGSSRMQRESSKRFAAFRDTLGGGAMAPKQAKPKFQPVNQ